MLRRGFSNMNPHLLNQFPLNSFCSFFDFRTFIGDPIYFDSKLTSDELAGKVQT